MGGVGSGREMLREIREDLMGTGEDTERPIIIFHLPILYKGEAFFFIYKKKHIKMNIG